MTGSQYLRIHSSNSFFFIRRWIDKGRGVGGLIDSAELVMKVLVADSILP